MQSKTHPHGFDAAQAAMAVIAALTVSGLVSRRYSPDPTHPRLRRWYKKLDKPGVTPPDPVFGAAWPILLTGLGAGAYRLLRRPPGARRDGAVALAALTLGLVTAYSKVTFGDRNLSAGVVESAVLVGVAASYVVVAAPVDRTAAGLGLPLALWSTFGSWLTVQLRDRNPLLDHGAA
jgi:benzodiazapine receptor